MNYITKTEAFAHHGATLTAPRGVWAKKSDDGKFVVLAAWRKGFNRDPLPSWEGILHVRRRIAEPDAEPRSQGIHRADELGDRELRRHDQGGRQRG